MRAITVLLLLGLVLGLLAGLSGCSRKAVEETPQVTPPDETDHERLGRMLDSLRASGQPTEAEEGVAGEEAEKTALTPLLLSDIHFEYDKATLTELSQSIMADNALELNQHRDAKVMIEGHCDERGSAEYNLALGERRANAARQYLLNYGIDPDRLNAVSYGEERPLDPAHDEKAWAKNRRAHFDVIGESR